MLLACYSVIHFLFLYIDFVNDLPRAWIKTRFLEGPVYAFLYFFVAGQAIRKDKLPIYIITGVALVWSITPILWTDRIPQWFENLRFFTSLLH